MPNHLAEDESGDKNETKNEDKSLKQREEEYAQVWPLTRSFSVRFLFKCYLGKSMTLIREHC